MSRQLITLLYKVYLTSKTLFAILANENIFVDIFKGEKLIWMQTCPVLVFDADRSPSGALIPSIRHFINRFRGRLLIS